MFGSLTLSEKWECGFFDQDSFIETLSNWAMTVVAGWARLGGIPCRVIAVETRSVECVNQLTQPTLTQRPGYVGIPPLGAECIGFLPDHTYTYTHTHTHTHMHTRTHTCTHTYTHTPQVISQAGQVW